MAELLIKLSLFGLSTYFQMPQIPIVGPEMKLIIEYIAPCARDFYDTASEDPRMQQTLCWNCDGRCFHNTNSNI